MTVRGLLLTIPAFLGACGSGTSLDPGKANSTDGATDSAPGAVQCTTCRVFVTSQVNTGDFGGLQGADRVCNNAAQAAGAGGTWTAWLADSKTAAIDRVHGDGPWYLMDKSTVAFPNHAALSVNPRTPLDQDERGSKYSPAYVWTGTNPFSPPTSCGDWTVATGTGTFVYAGAIYVNISDDDCSHTHSLICFEQ